MINHPNQRKRDREPQLYYLVYRSAITGTVTTAEYETEQERDERLARLKADPDVEWVAARSALPDNYW